METMVPAVTSKMRSRPRRNRQKDAFRERSRTTPSFDGDPAQGPERWNEVSIEAPGRGPAGKASLVATL